MARGIKDKVAILGMGCSKFGERWDSGAEELMLERGVIVSHATVRHRCAKFGQSSPTACAADSPGPGTSGTWTRSSSRSTESRSTCDGPSTPTATCSASS